MNPVETLTAPGADPNVPIDIGADTVAEANASRESNANRTISKIS